MLLNFISVDEEEVIALIYSRNTEYLAFGINAVTPDLHLIYMEENCERKHKSDNQNDNDDSDVKDTHSLLVLPFSFISVSSSLLLLRHVLRHALFLQSYFFFPHYSKDIFND